MKPFFLLLFIISANILKAQEVELKYSDFKSNFLGEEFLNYKGAYFTVDTSKDNSAYSFYNSLEKAKILFNKDVLYPNEEYNFETNLNHLHVNYFKVTQIYLLNGDTVGTSIPFGKYYIFQLTNLKTNEIIYYKYDKNYEHQFVFLVKLNQSVETTNYCEYLSRKVDEFTDVISYASPIFLDGSDCTMIIYKYIYSDSKIIYTLSINAYNPYLSVNGSQLIIIFEDGTKYIKTVDVNTDYSKSRNMYSYSAYIDLNQSDLNTFKNKKITKYRLHIFDEHINDYNATKFKEFVNCIITLK